MSTVSNAVAIVVSVVIVAYLVMFVCSLATAYTEETTVWHEMAAAHRAIRRILGLKPRRRRDDEIADLERDLDL